VFAVETHRTSREPLHIRNAFTAVRRIANTLNVPVGCGAGIREDMSMIMPAESNERRTGIGRKALAFASLLAGAVLFMTPPGHAGDDGAVVLGEYVTVLTLARDGAWGTATETSTSRAIAFAIRDCKAMSRRELGCGAMLTTVRSGWSIALLCGDETIIAASARLADAELTAKKREAELRHVYQRNMPPCVRIATVNPYGSVVTPPAQAVADRQ
jgi:hypothetical protein